MAVASPVTIRVQGLESLEASLAEIQVKLDAAVKAEIRAAGVIVRDDVRSRSARFGSRTTKGIRSRYRAGALYVEQSARKSPDLMKRRPNFAPLLSQVAFHPAMEGKTEAVFLKVQGAVDLAMRSSGL